MPANIHVTHILNDNNGRAGEQVFRGDQIRNQTAAGHVSATSWRYRALVSETLHVLLSPIKKQYNRSGGISHCGSTVFKPTNESTFQVYHIKL